MSRKQCTEPDCHSPASGRGLCSLHYQRYRYRGVLDEVAPAPETKSCAHCGTDFAASERLWGAIYCSKRCNDNARRARLREVRGRRHAACEQCGESLEGRRLDARFCSVGCGQRARNVRIAERTRLAMLEHRPPCSGCHDPIPEGRRSNASYCSERCKIRSRRHQAYGLTKQELDLLLLQNAACAICKAADWGKKGPQVDHCHSTGKVRGILCVNCNNGLGRFEDDPVRLRAAAEYVERS